MSLINEDIDKYYKMKKEYMNQKKKSVCVNCKKPGGTIFEESPTHLRAFCGADRKCGLSIDINKGNPVIQLPTLLTALREKLEKEKSKMIELKIKHAIGAVTDDIVIQQFDVGREQLRKLTTASAAIEEKLLAITNNPAKEEAINRLKADIYMVVQEYKSSLKDFEETGRDAFLKDAIEQYNNAIVPKVEELRETKYSLSMVEEGTGLNDDVSEYRLIQEPYTLRDLEVPFLPELRELLA